MYTTRNSTKQGEQDVSVFYYTKADWKDLEKHINENPIQPYRFSNVKMMVDLWYDPFYESFHTNIPMKTKHRRLP